MSFASRHIGIGADAHEVMREALGVANAEELLARAVPSSIWEAAPPQGLPEAMSQQDVLTALRSMAAKNCVRVSMIGQGYYDTITPAVIQRNILENPAWYTAYTPYQPEISQGRLEALLTFQTAVSDLTGLPVAGASLLDEATAAAEAMTLMHRAARKGSRLLVDDDAFDATKAVIGTRAAALGFTVDFVDVTSDLGDLGDVFGIVAQQSGASGRLLTGADIARLATTAHDAGALLTVASDILALTLISAPGEFGADVLVGSTQRLGVPMGFGGPNAGYIAVDQKYGRQLPGRLVGVSHDADGNQAYRLTLQTREQHIRREKATSNICTAQVLLAVMASMYAAWHGPDGLTAIARTINQHAVTLAQRLAEAGLPPLNSTFFDTLSIPVADADAALEALRDRNILGFKASPSAIRLSVDEATSGDVLDDVVAALAPFAAGEEGSGQIVGVPTEEERQSSFLTHEVFSKYRTETAMMRYMRHLANKDYALDRGMIPLGSCTMKLNSAIEMAAITWPGFSRIHPFAPAEDVAGYRELIDSLIENLSLITGYDTGSVQPNAGSQGEYAGLLAIKGYHEARGDTERSVCLIPASAHGTNAASAALAGFSVVTVASDPDGNIDRDDLDRKLGENTGRVGAIMLTYPSTHGVYEEHVTDVCAAVHAAGGQVYIDGANLNALVGVARPGAFGGDVSHLNLHKTFGIPHGGGGPGVGPVMVREHLAPYLPGHPLNPFGGRPDGAVSQGPFGSASILPIPWAYIHLLGREGLRDATAAAVLAANYIARRLEDEIPILYRGENGFVAHECILDLRELKKATGITVDDVAKRLMDYGFHAPTMSFPVAGTLMVEPTESEDLAEIDRLVGALLAIVQEARNVRDGVWPADDNPLVNAPHTARSVIDDPWEHPYSRQTAVYPAVDGGREPRDYKYWPPVRRIDGAWGDRNVFVTCPAPVEYLD